MLSKSKRLTLFSSIVLIILIGLISLLSSTFYILSHAEIDTKTPSDAILILGTRTRRPDGYNPCLLTRVQHGVELYKKGLAKKIIVTGGYNPEDHYVEAEVMSKIVLSLGVKESDLSTEKKSTSTYENLLFSKTILQDHSLKSAIIVSEAYHLPRADLIAQKLNIEHTISPAPNSPCWNEGVAHINFYSLRDAGALILYKIQGKI